MTTAEVKVKIRPMTRGDLQAVIDIDQVIRHHGEAMTYINITTDRVFSAKTNINSKLSGKKEDTIKEAFAKLLNLGFVAEAGGKVCGFVLGRIARAKGSNAEVGTIAILGVHPQYQRKGIASELVKALTEKFRNRKIETVRIAHRGVASRDTPLLDFIDAIRH